MAAKKPTSGSKEAAKSRDRATAPGKVRSGAAAKQCAETIADVLTTQYRRQSRDIAELRARVSTLEHGPLITFGDRYKRNEKQEAQQLVASAMGACDISVKPSTPQKPCCPRRETISRRERIAGMLFIAGLLAILTVAYFAGGPHP